jgi:hypothetical protein
VAVAAIDFQLPGMQLVAKANRLHRCVSNTRKFRCTVVRHTQNNSGFDQQNCYYDLHRNGVGPLWKNICHYFLSSRSANKRLSERFLGLQFRQQRECAAHWMRVEQGQSESSSYLKRSMHLKLQKSQQR